MCSYWPLRITYPQPPARDPSEPVTPYVNIIDPALAVVMSDPNHPNHVACREFFLHLSLNHDVMPEGESEEKIIYSASSPDESALVYAAKVRNRRTSTEGHKAWGIKSIFLLVHTAFWFLFLQT